MSPAQQDGCYAPASPTLRLQMAMPGTWRRPPSFPFDQPSLQCLYLARNGIYALARSWALAGQEVLFPAYFHGVEVETLLAAGVELRFYPVHAGMRVDVADIIATLTPRTRAVYLIHYLGFPGPVEVLSELCRERGLLLIEDCALALLSRLGQKPLGSFGDAAVFCLYKSLPVPNGGALLVHTPGAGPIPGTDSPSLASTIAYTASAIWRTLKFDGGGRIHSVLRKARKLSKAVSGRLGVVQVGSDHFDPAHVNLAMSRLCRWILARQDFQRIVEVRRRNYLHLLERLRDVSAPVFDQLPPGVCPLFYPLQTQYKQIVLDRLFQRGLEAVNFWSHTPSTLPQGIFPEVDELRRTIVELPCHQDLTPETMDWIADEVRALLRDLKDSGSCKTACLEAARESPIEDWGRLSGVQPAHPTRAGG
jgi:perosamine synthetase